jgi:hypothetical protein
MGPVTRRGVVVAGAAVALTACDGPSGSPDANPTNRRTPTGSPTSAPTAPTEPTSPTERALPDVTPWRADPGDVAPFAKQTAVHRIERMETGPRRAVQVIDAQYGGILTDSASVLVVTRSWRHQGPHVVAGGATYDVRLSRGVGGWRVTAIHPSRPGPAARRLTPVARRVLRSERIHLPPAATSDVRSGRIHDTVLQAMLTISATFDLHVSVLRSGHPLRVFGTDRLSDHPQGRAFDTWAIDGHPVVSSRTPRSIVEDYMHAAAAAGSYNVGGPYLLGSAPQWFSDNTHHDHVHAGFLT